MAFEVKPNGESMPLTASMAGREASDGWDNRTRLDGLYLVRGLVFSGENQRIYFLARCDGTRVAMSEK